MKIEKAGKQTPYGPQSSRPAAGSGSVPSDDYARFVWEELATRLVHPSKLAFIRALLESGEPLTLGALAEAANIDAKLAGCHCRRMEAAGVLEVVGVAPRADGEEEEPSYFFPEPSSLPTRLTPGTWQR